MEEYFPKFAAIFIVIEIIVVIANPLSILLSRHKYIEGYLKLSEDRQKKITRSNESLSRLLRLMLWLSPVYLVLVPLAIYYVLPEWTVYFILIDFLMFMAVLEMYYYEKWILKEIRSCTPALSQAPGRPSGPTS
jgi:hypothetical protein